jgi:hypothetical protein
MYGEITGYQDAGWKQLAHDKGSVNPISLDVNLLINYSYKVNHNTNIDLERPQIEQPFGSFPAFYGTRRFITEFTRALQLYLS